METTAVLLGPHHELAVLGSWRLSRRLNLDTNYRFTDSFSGIRAYHRVDTRLGWRTSEHWKFSIVGQHLLDNQHPEGPPLFAVPTEVGRGVYGKLSWGL